MTLWKAPGENVRRLWLAASLHMALLVACGGDEAGEGSRSFQAEIGASGGDAGSGGAAEAGAEGPDGSDASTIDGGGSACESRTNEEECGSSLPDFGAGECRWKQVLVVSDEDDNCENPDHVGRCVFFPPGGALGCAAGCEEGGFPLYRLADGVVEVMISDAVCGWFPWGWHQCGIPGLNSPAECRCVDCPRAGAPRAGPTGGVLP